MTLSDKIQEKYKENLTQIYVWFELYIILTCIYMCFVYKKYKAHVDRCALEVLKWSIPNQSTKFYDKEEMSKSVSPITAYTSENLYYQYINWYTKIPLFKNEVIFVE